MKVSDLVKSITALVALITLTFSGFFFLEKRYTQKPTFLALEKRVSLNELRRQLRQAEDDEAYYERLLEKYPGDQDIKRKLKKARQRIEKLEREIEKRENENELE